jgi:hypothetical protein
MTHGWALAMRKSIGWRIGVIAIRDTTYQYIVKKLLTSVKLTNLEFDLFAERFLNAGVTLLACERRP